MDQEEDETGLVIDFGIFMIKNPARSYRLQNDSQLRPDLLRHGNKVLRSVPTSAPPLKEVVLGFGCFFFLLSKHQKESIHTIMSYIK